MELWDDQVKVHHVIIWEYCRSKRDFGPYDTLLCSFPKSQQFCWQFQELIEAFLEQHCPFHRSIRVIINRPFLQKE